MTKFRFFKKKLQKKGANIAKEEALKTLLNQNDTQVDQKTFKTGLEAAIESKHATDKILAMMKLRSMISTKKLGSEDDKQTTHIAFPLNNKEITKIKAIPTYYDWKDKDTTPIENFITSYKSLGKLAKTKISWVITKMHNPKELAQLTLTTEKRSDERNEVRALLKFIQANPITPHSSIISTIINKKNTTDTDFLVYTLNVNDFISNANGTKGVILPNELTQILTEYKEPRKDSFTCGLSAHGNKQIAEYNTSLKELIEDGTINRKYPPLTPEYEIELQRKQWNQFYTSLITHIPKTSNELITLFERCLTNASFAKLKPAFESLSEAFAKKGTEQTTQITTAKGEIPKNIPGVPKKTITALFDRIFPPKTTQANQPDTPATNSQPQSFAGFSASDANAKFTDLKTTTLLKIWKTFSAQITSIKPKTSSELTKIVNRHLTNPCFTTLRTAFNTLGAAFDKTGEDKDAKIAAAKKQIPGAMELYGDDITKETIETLFDTIMKQ